MYRLYQFGRNKILLFLLLTASQFLFAQDNTTTIKGTLSDEQTGESIIGAFVYIKGTKIGGQTDVDGNFEIKTSQEPPFVLAVNYVGYENKEIEVYETDDAVQFKLRAQSALNEVVVVGYGEQKRSDITGSVSSVPTELKSQPVASVERLLQGTVAGAVVTQTSGQPGGGVSVQIRGANSINASSDPLYVIDGFPINNDYDLNDAGVTTGSKINPLSTLNTSDIESIDVLKDASATAIYGSRGANGVILVTTKRAKRNETTVTYDAYVGVQSIIRTIPLTTAGELWALRKDAAANTSAAAVSKLASDNRLARTTAANNGYTLDTTGDGTDWQAAAFRTAPITNHSLSILTGTDKTRLAFSGNYFQQEGILINTNFKRYTGRINLDHDVNERFKLSSSIVASNSTSKVAPSTNVDGTGGVVSAILQASPVTPIYRNDGKFLVNTGLDNPIANPINSLQNQINNTETTRLLGNVGAEYRIIPGLTAKVLFGVDLVNNKQNRYLPMTTQEGLNLKGSAYVGAARTNNWLNENTIAYTKTFDKVHAVNAIAGFTAQQSNTETVMVNGTNFANDLVSYNSLGDAGTLNAATSIYSKWTLASWLGRVNYVFNEKYLLTATVRSDGSSRFGDGNKWGTFPSVALGWNLHREGFLVSVKQVSALKLRASYGVTGNQSIPPYSSLSKERYYRTNFNNTTVAGYAPLNNLNANLGWERTRQFDIGLDVGLFNNRVNIIVDYYDKRTTDLLLNAPVSGTSGLSVANESGQPSYVLQNIGILSNKGWEVALNTQTVATKRFKWNTIFVFSTNKNKILELGNGVQQIIPNASNPSIQKVGYPIGSFIVYETNGLIQPGENGTNALTPQAFKGVGAQKYKDLNGDGVITQTGDRIIIANNPGLSLGLTNTFSYSLPFGTFDLTAFFQGSYGAKIYNQNRAILELMNGYANASANSVNRYSPSNTDTDVKAAYQEAAITISDRFIENGSYIRLKNLTFGYSLPESLLSKAKIKQVRAYISFQNWWTHTDYTGFDPEVSLSGQSLTTRGVDQGIYPNSKTVLGGLTFSF